jgi:glycine dehydrogenase subunit 2
MKDRIRKASRHTNQSEGLIFEKSSPGKRAFELPPLDVPPADALKTLGAHHRGEGVEGFPEVS